MSLGDALFTYEEKQLPPVVVITTALLTVALVAGAAIRLVLTLLL
ncbi:hypothetical protein ACFQO4_13285 [Saliphagus sp. GCM10025334]|nr:hypothetical protein [Natronosalvus caseinilyticus]